MSIILNKYPFGSRVYGTFTEDSDYDYIEVVDIYYPPLDTNTHVFTISSFQAALDNHDITVLEAYFLPDEMIFIKELNFSFTLNKFKLRESISTISSNSFVKGKKKLTITGDYDKKLGIKSVFHSLRILDFGIQIATDGKIVDYTTSNWILNDLYLLTENLDGIKAWKAIEDKYKSLYNSRASKFKSLCPKMNHNTLNNILTQVVRKYEVKEVGKMVTELEKLFNTYDTNKGIHVIDNAIDATPIGLYDLHCTCIHFSPNCFLGNCRNCGRRQKT